MRLRKMLTFAVLIVALVLIAGVFWLLMSPKSVIWSLTESGDPSPIPTYSIFNPFRERKSENEAERFLNLLKNEGCEKAVLSFSNQRNYDDMCESESRYKLEDWKLSYRNDGENKVELFYRVKRAPDSDYIWSLGINLEKKEGEWKISDVGSIY